MNRMSSLACIATIACTNLAADAAAQAAPYDCQNVARRMVIDAGPMRTAIAMLSRQTRCPVSIDARVDGLEGRALKGSMTPMAAAVMLVKGTGLEVVPINQGIGIGRYEQDAFDAEVAALSRKVGEAVRAGRLTPPRGASLRRQLAGVTVSVHQVARRQGFVSAAEKASYRRTIEAVRKTLS